MLDTLSIARRLSKSGMKREQAETIANVVADAVDRQNGNLATKDFVHGEIKSVRGEVSELRGEVSDLREDVSDLREEMKINDSALDAKISALEARLIRWVVGTGIGLGIFQLASQYLP